MNPRLAKDVVFTIVSSTDPEFLSEYMPANLLFRYEDKQAVMNENTLAGRLQRLVEMLRRECQVMKIEKEIADKVNESMDKNQRDYYLHEQLHVISDELGEGDDTHAEADEYRRKITALHLAEDKREEAAQGSGPPVQDAGLQSGSHRYPHLSGHLPGPAVEQLYRG